MKHELIKTDNYLLIVDGSEIKAGDYHVATRIVKTNGDNAIAFTDQKQLEAIAEIGGAKKIIAHLPLNNSPILEGVDLLLPLEDDENLNIFDVSGRYILEEAKKFAMEKFNADKTKSKYPKGGWISIDDILSVLEVGVECGYKFGQKSKEKYKYTEEDLRKMYDMSCGEIGLNLMPDQSENNQRFEAFIQSLSQPKMPIGFECEMVYRVKSGTIQEHREGKAGYEYYEPKTITNSQGQTVWVGKYIY